MLSDNILDPNISFSLYTNIVTKAEIKTFYERTDI